MCLWKAIASKIVPSMLPSSTDLYLYLCTISFLVVEDVLFICRWEWFWEEVYPIGCGQKRITVGCASCAPRNGPKYGWVSLHLSGVWGGCKRESLKRTRQKGYGDPGEKLSQRCEKKNGSQLVDGSQWRRGPWGPVEGVAGKKGELMLTCDGFISA